MLNQFEIWTVLALPAIVLPPVAVWLIMHVFGAMQYDMEHRNHLLDEYTRREKVLARFPEVNPNPIYKNSKRGEIVLNPAATKLLEDAQISKDEIGSVLPVNYQEGLKGEEIPLSARLMALADVYDALISKRVYKPAFPHEKARDLIVKARGTHFDPVIADAFVEIEEEFKDIAARFPD